MPSSRLAWSPRDCSSISPSPHPSLFGVPSGLGCAPFVPTSRHRSLSWQKRCARHFPNFSWGLQKAFPSRNSSPSGRTCKTCHFSAWLRKQKTGTLEFELPQLGEHRTLIRDDILLQGRGFIVI